MSNGHLLFASETTWGTTPASGWRALEASSDGHKTAQEYLQHKGLRAGGLWLGKLPMRCPACNQKGKP